jgi:hypothetical protein
MIGGSFGVCVDPASIRSTARREQQPSGTDFAAAIGGSWPTVLSRRHTAAARDPPGQHDPERSLMRAAAG